jgi:hypothetical protein
VGEAGVALRLLHPPLLDSIKYSFTYFFPAISAAF